MPAARRGCRRAAGPELPRSFGPGRDAVRPLAAQRISTCLPPGCEPGFTGGCRGTVSICRAAMSDELTPTVNVVNSVS